MNSTLMYIIENWRIYYWKQFIKTTTNDIFKLIYSDTSEIDNIFRTKNKIRKQIIFFYTFIIGIADIYWGTPFLNKPDLLNNMDILISSLSTGHPLNSDIVDKINKLIVHHNHYYKKLLKSAITMSEQKYKNYVIKTTINVIKDTVILDIYIENNRTKKKKRRQFTIKEKHFNRLKELYYEYSNEESNVFNIYVAILLLRYEFYESNKEGINLSVSNIYKYIKTKYNEDSILEAFAGSLNSNLINYCSLFYDIEKYFGSQGNFFNINLNNCPFNIIISNPPYIVTIIEKSIHVILNALDVCNAKKILMNCVIIILDLRSETEYDKDKDMQISINEKKQDRVTYDYDGYNELRNSEFFRHLFVIGNYTFYDFFSGKKRSINSNTLIILLSNDNKNDNKNDNIFINDMIDFISNEYMRTQ